LTADDLDIAHRHEVGVGGLERQRQGTLRQAVVAVGNRKSETCSSRDRLIHYRVDEWRIEHLVKGDLKLGVDRLAIAIDHRDSYANRARGCSSKGIGHWSNVDDPVGAAAAESDAAVGHYVLVIRRPAERKDGRRERIVGDREGL